MSYRRWNFVLCTKALLERILCSRLRHCWVAELAPLEILEGIDLLESASEPPNVLQLTLCLGRWIESVVNACLTEQGLHVHHSWVLIEIWLLLLESLIQSCCKSSLLPWSNHAWTTTKWTWLERESCSSWKAIGHSEPSLCLLQDLS